MTLHATTPASARRPGRREDATEPWSEDRVSNRASASAPDPAPPTHECSHVKGPAAKRARLRGGRDPRERVRRVVGRGDDPRQRRRGRNRRWLRSPRIRRGARRPTLLRRAVRARAHSGGRRVPMPTLRGRPRAEPHGPPRLPEQSSPLRAVRGSVGIATRALVPNLQGNLRRVALRRARRRHRRVDASVPSPLPAPPRVGGEGPRRRTKRKRKQRRKRNGTPSRAREIRARAHVQRRGSRRALPEPRSAREQRERERRRRRRDAKKKQTPAPPPRSPSRTSSRAEEEALLREMLEDAANAAVVGDTPTTGWKTTPAGFERATPSSENVTPNATTFARAKIVAK